MLFESEKDFLGQAAMMATSDLNQPVVQRVRDILKGDAWHRGCRGGV
jgi:hypothetical protein